MPRILRFWNRLTHLAEVSSINQFQLQIQKQARNHNVRQEHFAVQRLSSAPRQSKFSSPSSLPSEPMTPLFLMYSVPSPERDVCQVAATTCEVNDKSWLLGLSPYHIKQRQQTPRCDVPQSVKRRPGSGRGTSSSSPHVAAVGPSHLTSDGYRGHLPSWLAKDRDRASQINR